MTKLFKRHPKHGYEGYQFPWYITLMWIAFFSCAVIYVVRFIVLK